MRFSVLGFKSDIRIELQAPVIIYRYNIKFVVPQEKGSTGEGLGLA